MSEDFAISESLDVQTLRASFARRGRVEIPDFLAEGCAEALRQHLLVRQDWRLVLNAGSQVYELPRSRLGELSAAQRSALDSLVTAAARGGFQYRYETIRVPDDQPGRTQSGTLLDRFVTFMSSQEILSLLGEIIGDDELRFADGQATAYSPGHFLTRHDDDVAGKERRAAYVFGLQPNWNADWGGLLMFHGADGNIVEAFTPAMGALRLFRVPMPHSVSFVAPLAPEPRLSITGWLRAQPPAS